MSDNDPQEYATQVTCIQENPKSLRLEDEDGKKFWVPKSVIHDDSEVWKEDDSGKLVVKTWFAEKEGWD